MWIDGINQQLKSVTLEYLVNSSKIVVLLPSYVIQVQRLSWNAVTTMYGGTDIPYQALTA